MKNLILSFFLLLTSNFLISQSANSPDVAWKNVEWPHYIPDNPLLSVAPGGTAVPGGYQSRGNSGEDWWYDLANIYDGTEHVGYMVCGYATWQDIVATEGNIGGCVNFNDIATGPDCSRPILSDELLGTKLSTIARYDLNGNMLWCKPYCTGAEGAYAIKRTTDDFYIFTGWATASLDVQGNPIPFNPGGASGGIATVDGFCDVLKTKMFVGKIDVDGNLQWLNQYGHEFGGGFTVDDIRATPSIGTDLEQLDMDTYRVVGHCQDLNDLSTPGDLTSGRDKMFVVDINSSDGSYDGSSILGLTGSASSARAITVSGSETFITGFQQIMGPKNAILFKIDGSRNIIDFGNDPWVGGSTAAIRYSSGTLGANQNIGWDVEVLADGSTVAWAFLENCKDCGGGGPDNLSEARVYLIENIAPYNTTFIEMEDVNTYGFTNVNAWDMRIGLVATNDGGFACVTSYQVAPVDHNIEPYVSILNNLDAQVAGTGVPYCQTVPEDDNYEDINIEFTYGFWNTNAWVGKFDASGNMLWDKSFDADNLPPTAYPGDFKQQECVFRITEADDGSLVFVGNTSDNKDDYYIAKINSDCQLKGSLDNSYDLNYNDNDFVLNATQTWTVGTSISGLFIAPYTFGAVNTFDGKLVIPAGVVLTIDGITLEFTDSRKLPYESKVIIEPGGELRLINGAKLTSYSGCPNSMWSGVEVWGDATKIQTTAFQGKLVMNTGAEIENAIIGVACVKREGFVKDLTKTGGILQIQDAVFRNNLIGIEIRPYQNHHPLTNALIDNVSLIRTTNFITDAPFKDIEIANVVVGSQTLPRAQQEFILLDGIRGVKILGNTFDNAIADNFEGFRKGYGILAWDSDFDVKAYSTIFNDPNPTENEFSNLWVGIYVKPMGQVNDVVIDDNVFTNNHYGVLFEGSVNYARIVNNDFFIDENINWDLANGHAGIYTKVASGFQIENNNFTGLTQTSIGNNVGIFVEDASTVASAEIYKNNFELLDLGIQTKRNNSSLNVDCNTFVKSTPEDQVGWHNAPASVVAFQGICDVGDATLPQANFFDGTWIAGSEYQILNEGGYFEYHTHGNPGYFPTNTNGLPLILVDNCGVGNVVNACPSKTGLPNYTSETADIAQLHAQIDGLVNEIDGGSTPALVSFIQTETRPWAIRDELLIHSPYLSDEALITLVNKPGIAPYVVDEVLTANAPLSENVLLALFGAAQNFAPYIYSDLVLASSPVKETVLIAALNHAPALPTWVLNDLLIANTPLTDETLIAALQRMPKLPAATVRDVLKINTPLSVAVNAVFQTNNYPKWVSSAVYASAVVAADPISKSYPISPRGDLEREIAYKEFTILLKVDYMVRFYLDSNDFVPAVLLLEEENTIQASCTLLPLLLETRDGQRLYEHIQRIRDEADADPSSPISEHRYALCDYYELMYQVRIQPGGLEAITEPQLTKLLTYSEQGIAMSVNNSNVLQYLELEDFVELQMQNISFGSLIKSAEFMAENTSESEIVPTQTALKIYPNPTTGLFTIEYSLTGNAEQSQVFIVYDLLGQEKLRIQIDETNTAGTVQVDLSSFANGVYLIVLITDNTVISTNRIVLQN